MPVRYRTVAVERGTVISLVTATGTINPITTIRGSQVSGMIESVPRDFNSRVKANQVVARIDPFPTRPGVTKRRPVSPMPRPPGEARIDLAQRRRELDRAKSPSANSSSPKTRWDVALTASEGALAQLKVTEAAVKQAEAMLQAAELDLKYTVIRSPVDGVVISRRGGRPRFRPVFPFPPCFDCRKRDENAGGYECQRG